ncbi:MAG: prolipoprotein diacylglyceryl transferase [Alphaproteobacteria bacterium]|nr:prolipoprotein diacylglyceryl transferase [Alphaproteobacteria bacterium]
MAITLNPISPVAFSILGLDIRWYALAYIAGFICGYYLFKHLCNKSNSIVKISKQQIDDLLTAIVLGVIVGGRLGYVLFYNLQYFLAHPIDIFAVWHGGMSFHGGLIGVLVAIFLFARKQKQNPWALLDLMAVVAPIGLFFGRIANFINREVMGRPTDAPWAVVFNGDTPVPRHPSPLYEAATEGALLFVIMYYLYKRTNLRNHPGALAGIMGMLYAIFRMFCEQFRAPDTHIGFLTSWGLTMGQLLSGLMFIGGAVILACALKRNKL